MQPASHVSQHSKCTDDLAMKQALSALACAGGRGMRLLNNATGEVLCQSNTTYGSGPRGEAAAAPLACYIFKPGSAWHPACMLPNLLAIPGIAAGQMLLAACLA